MRESYPLIGRLGQRWFSEEVQKLDGRSQLAMVHLWLIPNPKGMFATHNPELVYRDLGLPRRWASTDMEIARGLALSTSRGCRDALDAELWIAGASRSKKRTLMRACEAIAADVRDPLGTPEARLESRAKAEWRRLEDMKLMTLSAAELRRIDAFVEDGPGICR